MAGRRTRHTPPPDASPQEAPWTLIGPGSVIHGELLMAGNVLIHGRVEGILFTDGEVRVMAGGIVEGGIHARRIVVLGFCEGRLEATEEVFLSPGAVLRGEIEAPIFTLSDGARFVGDWSRNRPLRVPPGPALEKPPGRA